MAYTQALVRLTFTADTAFPGFSAGMFFKNSQDARIYRMKRIRKTLNPYLWIKKTLNRMCRMFRIKSRARFSGFCPSR
jgi:hypothetical protein